MIKIATPQLTPTDNLDDLTEATEAVADDSQVVAAAAEIMSEDIGSESPANGTITLGSGEIKEAPPMLPPGRTEVTAKEYATVVNLCQEMFEAEQEGDSTAKLVEYLDEQLKEAKNRVADCLERKIDIMAALRRICRGDTVAEMVDSLVVKEEPKPDSDGNNTAWRDMSITTLLDPPIPGCGPKKVDAIEHEVGTLGKFEDLRVEAGNKSVGLHTLLPKGVGEELASELEERHLSAIVNPKLAAPPAIADDKTEAGVEAEVAVEESQSKDVTPIEAVSKLVDELGEDPEGEEPTAEDPKPKAKTTKKAKSAKKKKDEPPAENATLTEEQEAELERQQVLNRVEELRPTIETEIAEGVAEHSDDENWLAGRRAAESGDPATDCAWTAGEKQDVWLSGWLTGTLDPDLDDLGDVDDEDEDDIDLDDI